jgi:hypothetical protein
LVVGLGVGLLFCALGGLVGFAADTGVGFFVEFAAIGVGVFVEFAADAGVGCALIDGGRVVQLLGMFGQDTTAGAAHERSLTFALGHVN